MIAEQSPGPDWTDVGSVADITKRKKAVVDVRGHQVLVLVHEGSFYAFDNICIHRQRELARGVVLNGRLICPGHQWAFELGTGWESIKQECQPTYAVRIHGDVVQVDAVSRSASARPDAADAADAADAV